MLRKPQSSLERRYVRSLIKNTESPFYFMTYILFDIGGTKTRVAVSRDLETMGKTIKYDTPMSYEEGIDALKKAIKELGGDETITAVAGGIRGTLNETKTGIVSESILTDWVGKDIAGDIGAEVGAPVYLENDAALVGLGEAHFGAGKGATILAYHTVSTGVGGARIVEGKIDRAHGGFEPGHQVLDIDRSVLGPETPHTLENLVSGASLEKRRGVKPYEIPQSDGVWDELADFLAEGLKNTVLYWSPDRIVLGGSMIVGDPRILLADIIRHTEEKLAGEVPPPPIVDAVLKDEGGLFGAMALIRQQAVS